MRARSTSVSDYCVRSVVTAERDTPVARCARMMHDEHVGCVVVVESRDGRRVPVGMLTDRDICMAGYTQGKLLCDISVRTAMSKSLHSCSPDTSVESIEQLMMQNQIRRIPVIDTDGHPIGIVSLNDLARAANKQHPSAHGASNGPSLNATARTMAAICAPRQQESAPRHA